MGIKSVLGKVGAALFAATFLAAGASAGEYFVPEGMLLVDGGLFAQAETAITGLYTGSAHDALVRLTGLFVGKGF